MDPPVVGGVLSARRYAAGTATQADVTAPRSPAVADLRQPGQHRELFSREALTWPNLLSASRLLGVPVFLWLLLGPHADGWALAVLACPASPTGPTGCWPAS